jgi:tetratricopeptide (TPR) repeat protein
MNGPTDWVSAAAIVSAGIIVGLLVIFFVRRKRAGLIGGDIELRDLEAARDGLLDQLREPGLTPDARTRLEIETARVLRQIDERSKTAKTVTQTVTTADPFRRGVIIGFASGAATVLALAGMAYFVVQSSNQNEVVAAPAPSVPAATATNVANEHAAEAAADPKVQKLEAVIQSSPENLDARVELARAYLDHNNLMGVFEQTRYVLAKSPNDARALTYQAVVRLAMGQRDDAAAMLAKATKFDPMFLDAWIATAWMDTQNGEIGKAEAAMKEAARRHPEEKTRLDVMFENMKVQAQQASAPPAGMPQGHPPIEANSVN